MYLSLKHFLPSLAGHHVLVRMDNTTTVAYINRRRGVTFPSITHAGTQTDPLEQRASPLPESNARPRDPEHGPAVNGRASIRGVDSAPGDRGVDMDALRSGCSGSVHVEGKCTVRTVLLPVQHGCSPGHRHISARLAARASLQVPSTGSNTPHSVQNEGTWPHADSNSSTPACNALASRDLSVAVRSALATPAAQGPAVAGRGDGVSPTPGAPRTVGLAREWLDLTAVGLPQRVIATIQNSRASSTRSLYGCKWRMFEEWCHKEGHISF